MQPSCPNCRFDQFQSGKRANVVRSGHFYRKHDRKYVQRYLCHQCQRRFSTSSNDPCFRQHKPYCNQIVADLLCSRASQRRIARLLSINRKTVVRKFIFSAGLARLALRHWNLQFPPAKIIEFDDLETFEHTKMKPVSVTVATVFRTRRILGLEAAPMPAKGLLAKRSVKKYGKRIDQRTKARNKLFAELKPLVAEFVLIKSDQNPSYPASVRQYFPAATHHAFKGRCPRGSGQGELKKGGFDPLFSLNHTCAMLRDNLNRLTRETWSTTKKVERLQMHLDLYAFYHNTQLI